MSSGALLFARYAYPPNALGYCGADENRTLLEYGDAGVVDGGLVQLARTFEGAWPYLELIAGANGIGDPLDQRVVEAYWVGSPLLERVDGSSLAAHLDERFRRRAGRSWELLATSIPDGGVPHHDFHVFGVYPWVGLLRSGDSTEPLRVLESCRITPGRVVEVDGEEATVLARPLLWDGRRLRLGAPAARRAAWRRDGLGFLAELRPGDWVSLHWAWVCDRLDPAQARSLARYTRRMLAVANRATAPAALS
ncbi:MAG TPA: DUF6390 family protein [Gaiellaceae bacterium]|jgi:hypothetical protein|nr:DUF6390 family protein [Gaiellaceae bacterium]